MEQPKKMLFIYVITMQLVAATVAFSSYVPPTPLATAVNGHKRPAVQTGISSTTENVDSGLSVANGDKSRESTSGMLPLSDAPAMQLPRHLVAKLDLDPLLRHVSSYACTKRGKDAILSVLPTPASSALDLYLNKSGKPSLFGNKSKRREWYQNNEGTTRLNCKIAALSAFPIAQSASEAIHEYNLVNQAMEVLRSQNSLNRIPLPPMFDLRGSDSTNYTPDTDDDEWIGICLNPSPMETDILEEIDLYMILQAEQVTKMLLNMYEWALNEEVSRSVPSLSDTIVKTMQQDIGDCKNTIVSSLSELYTHLRGAIEIVKEGSKSYQFRLSSSHNRFAKLNALRQQEEECLSKLDKTGTGSNEKAKANKLALIREEIALLESQIQKTLIAAIMCAAPDAESAFNALARLDVIFSKAAFGLDWNGVIPEVAEEGRINVHNFVHPVLAIEKKFEAESGSAPEQIVPIDLLMPGAGTDSYQALMISGPNSGGKTLALKSFGLAAIMVKLALPITLSQKPDGGCIVVDYFPDIVAEIGDNQSVLSGESTLMARLNSLSALIEKSSAASDVSSRLVLLDELGGGTDPIAGASLAQAILERILSNSSFKIVATTHSPELKSLSLTNDKFQSACVTLESRPNEGLSQTDSTNYSRKPTYQLRYGATGESYTLSAASRCHPTLPLDVIERAAQLMSKGNDNGDALRSHLEALDREIIATNSAKVEAESIRNELRLEKEDTLVKLETSNIYLSRLESRLESIYQTLSEDATKSVYELVGDSLEELKLVRRKVKSEQEALAEKGLRRVPDSYSFYDGETVVIIAEGEFQGYNAVVKVEDETSESHSYSYETTVVVVPTLDLFSLDEEGEPPLELKRSDIAIWDYGFGEYDDYSVQKPKRSSERVMSLLSSLNVDKKATKSTFDSDKSNNAFKSSRQRKASRKGKKKR